MPARRSVSDGYSFGLPKHADPLDRFCNFQPQESERHIITKDGNQQQLIVDLAEVQIFVLTFVKQKRKFVLPDDFGHCIDRPEVPGRQGIDALVAVFTTAFGDDVAGHVNQKCNFYAIGRKIRFKNLLRLFDLLLVERMNHNRMPFAINTGLHH